MKSGSPIFTFQLEGAVVSTSSFAMFAARNISDFGLEQLECPVR
jgi:hypothetical protein